MFISIYLYRFISGLLSIQKEKEREREGLIFITSNNNFIMIIVKNKINKFKERNREEIYVCQNYDYTCNILLLSLSLFFSHFKVLSLFLSSSQIYFCSHLQFSMKNYEAGCAFLL